MHTIFCIPNKTETCFNQMVNVFVCVRVCGEGGGGECWSGFLSSTHFLHGSDPGHSSFFGQASFVHRHFHNLRLSSAGYPRQVADGNSCAQSISCTRRKRSMQSAVTWKKKNTESKTKEKTRKKAHQQHRIVYTFFLKYSNSNYLG